jgi:REP element-mobilizing transposase RayT
MPRPLRVQEPGIYHVMTQGVRRSALFRDGRDRTAWVDLLPTVCNRYHWTCLSYCVMTTHYHLLVWTQLANLADGMQWLNGRWGQLFNRRHGEVGHVVRCRYHAVAIQSEKHLLELARYMPLNPVRAGACLRPRDWPWSSFPALIGVEPKPAWLDGEALLTFFGTGKSARDGFAAFVHDGLGAVEAA